MRTLVIGSLAILAVGLMAPLPAQADVNTSTATLSVDPNPAQVGETVTLSAEVDSSGGHNPNPNGATDSTVAFDISTNSDCSAPYETSSPTVPEGADPAEVQTTTSFASPGTFYVKATFSGWSSGTHGVSSSSSDCVPVTVEAPPPVDVKKTLNNDGVPHDDTDSPIDTVNGQNLVINPNDAGGIWVGLGEQQFFHFEIMITNQSGDTIEGDIYVIDTVPGEFDLSGDPAVKAGDEGKCSVVASRAPGASEGNLPKLEPEFLTISIDDLDNEDSCTVIVWVKTDGNPGHLTTDGGNPADDSTNVWSLFEPTSCRQIAPLEEGVPVGGVPINDTIALNDGLKVFQVLGDDPARGVRMLGPVGSLQLTANGCDFDGDSVQDLEDACPIEGDLGFGVDANGCPIEP